MTGLKMTETDAIALRSYATALQDLLEVFTGDRTDRNQPESLVISIDGEVICTHAFRLGSDIPIHRFEEFESVQQIKELMLEEVAELMERDAVELLGFRFSEG